MVIPIMSFTKKFETFYNSKKTERIKKIGENQNNELEKNFFTNY